MALLYSTVPYVSPLMFRMTANPSDTWAYVLSASTLQGLHTPLNGLSVDIHQRPSAELYRALWPFYTVHVFSFDNDHLNQQSKAKKAYCTVRGSYNTFPLYHPQVTHSDCCSKMRCEGLQVHPPPKGPLPTFFSAHHLYEIHSLTLFFRPGKERTRR